MITFDDGMYDFFALAYPLLQEFGYPATVYLTTYYSEYNRPVFDLMCSYLLWKARGERLTWPDLGFNHFPLDVAARTHVATTLKSHSEVTGMSGRDKDALIIELAARLNIDFEPIRRSRLIHLMNPTEVAAIARAGIDIQLHTHRHKSCRTHDGFVGEIVENQQRIEAVSGVHARHFSYPGGVHLPEYPAWLRAEGIQSATTCEARLATCRDDRMLLPRLVDSDGLSIAEFRASVAGVTEFVPNRRIVPHDGAENSHGAVGGRPKDIPCEIG